MTAVSSQASAAQRLLRGARESQTRAAPPQISDDTTEAQGGAEEAHRRWPEGRSEQGASKAKVIPPGFEARSFAGLGMARHRRPIRQALAN